MNEFDGIEGFDAWRKKLRQLLAEAEAAAANPDAQARFRICQRLTAFMENSRPNDAAVLSLDEVAGKVAEALLDQTIEERLASIVAANARLAGIAKAFAIETESAQSEAANLRLERATKAVEALNTGISSLKELASALETGRDDALLQSVDKTVKAARQLRLQLESV